MSSVEQVMVIPTETFLDCGYFLGFCSDIDKYISKIFEAASFKPRPEMEEDTNFKQLIPYCVIKYGKHIFNYQRSKKQGESRLHGKWSLGVGGHISSEDVGEICSYRTGMLRELTEEINLEEKRFEEKCIGLINDDSNAVGRVHLGIVHVIELNEFSNLETEESMANGRWSILSDLEVQIADFENWSQIILESARI